MKPNWVLDLYYFSKQINKEILCASKLETNIEISISWQLNCPKRLFSLSYVATEDYRETSVSKHILRTGYTLGSDSLRTK